MINEYFSKLRITTSYTQSFYRALRVTILEISKQEFPEMFEMHM